MFFCVRWEVVRGTFVLVCGTHILRDAYATRRMSTIFVYHGVGTCQGAGCQYRPRALGLRRGVAGDVVLLLVVVSGSSIVDNVFGVLSFFSQSQMFSAVISHVLLFFR